MPAGRRARRQALTGHHGNFSGSNPVTPRQRLAVLQVLQRRPAWSAAPKSWVKSLRHGISARPPSSLRCADADCFVELTLTAARQDAGPPPGADYLVNAGPHPTSPRMAPPLIIAEAQLDGFVAALPVIWTAPWGLVIRAFPARRRSVLADAVAAEARYSARGRAERRPG